MRRGALAAVVAALALLLVPTDSAHADIYACRDRQGNTHYTNMRDGSMASCKLVVRGNEQARAKQTRRGPSRARRGSYAPDRFTRYDAHILEAARLYQLPIPFIKAVMHVESSFSPDVVSVDGAMGLMQLMPATARAMGVEDPFNPRQNILGGARFLRVLANRFNGDLVLTIAAYNAGQGAVERYSGVPPYAETRRYVRKVLNRYYEYKGVQ